MLLYNDGLEDQRVALTSANLLPIVHISDNTATADLATYIQWVQKVPLVSKLATSLTLAHL